MRECTYELSSSSAIEYPDESESTLYVSALTSLSSHRTMGKADRVVKLRPKARTDCAEGPSLPSIFSGSPTTSPPTPSFEAMAATFSESAVPTVAVVAEALGLPGIGLDAARTSRNKLLMRQAHERADIPRPRFRLVRDLASALDTARANAQRLSDDAVAELFIRTYGNDSLRRLKEPLAGAGLPVPRPHARAGASDGAAARSDHRARDRRGRKDRRPPEQAGVVGKGNGKRERV